MADLVRSKAVVLLVLPLLFLFTKSSIFLASLSTFSLLVLSLVLFPVQYLLSLSLYFPGSVYWTEDWFGP